MRHASARPARRTGGDMASHPGLPPHLQDLAPPRDVDLLGPHPRHALNHRHNCAAGGHRQGALFPNETRNATCCNNASPLLLLIARKQQLGSPDCCPVTCSGQHRRTAFHQRPPAG
jgi:hypothetical protein